MRPHIFKYVIFTLFGIFLGVCIPLVFIFLDLQELGLHFDYNNAQEVARSQLIYPFSFIVFPFLFGVTSFLFGVVQNERDRSKKYGEYVTAILNGISDPVLVYTHQGKIIDSNTGFRNLFGLQQIKNVEEIQKGILKTLENKNLIEELCLDVGEGISRCFTIKRSLLLHGDHRYVLAFTDITHIKEQQRVIEEQKAKLHDAARLSALGEMASGFAHEINNPLMIISGHVTMMERLVKKEKFDAEKFIEKAGIIFKTIDRISHIIQALRNLARNTDSINLTRLTIAEVVEDISSLSKMKLSGRDVDLSIHLNGLDKREIRCDLVQLGQVFINLINNAVDAVEDIPQAWIRFEVQESESSYIFSVTDSGLGISETISKKIFEPMFTTKPVGKGTGLGLSLSRSIIEKHNGHLELDQKSPNTRFLVVLPKCESES